MNNVSIESFSPYVHPFVFLYSSHSSTNSIGLQQERKRRLGLVRPAN